MPQRKALLCTMIALIFFAVCGVWLYLFTSSPPSFYPPAGEHLKIEAPFRFAVISDTRGNMASFEEGMARIRKMDVSLILHAGDIVERFNERQFDWILHELDEMDLSVPFCPVPGDHDTDERAPDSMGRYPLYSNAFGPRRYWFVCGNVLFVAFDDSTETVTPENLAWLDKTLSQHRSDYQLCFVLFHVPPCNLKPAHTLNDADSQKLMHLLSKYNVSAALTGHLHSYAHYEVEGVPVYSTGGLGEEGPAGEPHSFLIFNVESDGTFSAEKHDVALAPNSDYLEYAFRTKFPLHGTLAAALVFLLAGTTLSTLAHRRASGS